jgi:hypothetical protein
MLLVWVRNLVSDMKGRKCENVENRVLRRIFGLKKNEIIQLLETFA